MKSAFSRQEHTADEQMRGVAAGGTVWLWHWLSQQLCCFQATQKWNKWQTIYGKGMVQPSTNTLTPMQSWHFTPFAVWQEHLSAILRSSLFKSPAHRCANIAQTAIHAHIHTYGKSPVTSTAVLIASLTWMTININVCRRLSRLLSPCFSCDLFSSSFKAERPNAGLCHSHFPPFSFWAFGQVHKKQQYFLSLEHFLYSRTDRMMENDYQTLCHPFLNPTRRTKSPCRKMIATLWLTAIKKRKHFCKKKMLFGFAWTVEQEPFTKQVKFARHVCVMCSNL